MSAESKELLERLRDYLEQELIYHRNVPYENELIEEIEEILKEDVCD